MLSWKLRESSESPFIIIHLRPSPSMFLGIEEKQWCNFFSFNSQQRCRQLIRYHRLHLPYRPFETAAAAASPKIYSDPRNPVFQSGWRKKKRVWKWGKSGRRQRLLWAVSTVDQRLERMGFTSSFTDKVCFRCGYRPSTIPLRGYQITTIPYTNNNGHGPRHHHQQSHSVGGTTATSSLLFPPNVDFHTG